VEEAPVQHVINSECLVHLRTQHTKLANRATHH
jgi:hypothetical protein